MKILIFSLLFILLFPISSVLAQQIQLPPAGGSYIDPITGNTVYRITDRQMCPAGADHVYSDTFEHSRYGTIVLCRYNPANLNLWRWILIGPDHSTIIFNNITTSAKSNNVPYNFGELQWLPNQKRILGRNGDKIFEFDPWNGVTTLYVQMPTGCHYDWRLNPQGQVVARTNNKLTMCIFDPATGITSTKDVGSIASNPDQTSALFNGKGLFTWDKNPQHAWNPDFSGEIIFDDFQGHLGQFQDANGQWFTVNGKEDRLASGGVGQIGCPGIAWRPEGGIYSAQNGSRVLIWACDQPAGVAAAGADRDHFATSAAVNRFESSGHVSIAQWDVDWTAGKVTRTELAQVHRDPATLNPTTGKWAYGYAGSPFGTADYDFTEILFSSGMCDGQMLESDGTVKSCSTGVKQNLDLYVVQTKTGASGPPGPDTTPPNVYGGVPSTALPLGTTSTQMSVATNEQATCRYSTTPNTAYSSMTNTMTASGNVHTATINGLANGGSYNYYVRCIDTNNNVDTNDYTISFSVSQITNFGRPVSDVTTGWNGTVTPHWSNLDEVIASDTDAIRTGFSAGTQVDEVKLSNMLTPSVKTGHILKVRAYTDGTGNTLTYQIVQGTTVIASANHILPVAPITYTNDSFTLTTANASQITDYSDLRVRLIGNAMLQRIFVSWIEFEVPSGGTPPFSGLILNGRITRTTSGTPCASCTIDITLAGQSGSATTNSAGDFSIVLTNQVTPGQYIADISVNDGVMQQNFKRRVTV